MEKAISLALDSSINEIIKPTTNKDGSSVFNDYIEKSKIGEMNIRVGMDTIVALI